MSVHHYGEHRTVRSGRYDHEPPIRLHVAALGDDEVSPSHVFVVQAYIGHVCGAFSTDRAGAQILVDMLTEALAAGPQPVAECSYVDAVECAMVRERSVAGTDDEIPTCPQHALAPGFTDDATEAELDERGPNPVLRDCLHGGYHAPGTCPEANAEAVTA